MSTRTVEDEKNYQYKKTLKIGECPYHQTIYTKMKTKDTNYDT